MRSLELKPTPEILLKTYKADSIGRNKHLHYFIDILDSIDCSHSIAIDGRWGCGKTFFVKQAKMILDSFNEYINVLSNDDRYVIQDTWKKHHKDEPERILNPQVCVYYDAWEHDNDEDPLLSLMYEILATTESDYVFDNTDDNIYELFASIGEIVSSRNLTNFLEVIRKKENTFNEIKKNRDLHKATDEFLSSLLSEKGNRCVIFVDELDRCSPSYAVRLLERIKHYFMNDSITFVFSINSLELQNTIKQHYGNNFDACRYLDRFFDLPINLPPADLKKYYNYISLGNMDNIYESIASSFIKKYDLQMREISRYMKVIRIAASKALNSSESNFDFSFNDGRGKKFALNTILPIMLGLKMIDNKKYHEFISGDDASPLINTLSNMEHIVWICRPLLDSAETFETPSAQCTLVTIEQKLTQVYENIFASEYTNENYEKNIGTMYFTADTKKMLINTMSLLSIYSDYND